MLQKLIHVSYLFFFVCTYLGFNLMIGGHFMPETLLPYIFLILLCGLIPLWKDAMQKIYHKQNIPIFFICFLFTSAFYFLQLCLRENGWFYLFKTIIKCGFIGFSSGILILIFKKKIKYLTRLSLCHYVSSACILIYFYLCGESNLISAFPFILLLLLFLNSTNPPNNTSFQKVTLCIASVIFALFQLAGDLPDYKEDGLLPLLTLIIFLTGMIAWYNIFKITFTLLFKFIDNVIIHTAMQKKITTSAHLSFVTLSLLILTRIPFYCNWFPGLISKDTLEQIREFIGEVPPSNHQPWLHTLFIGFFLKLGELFHLNYQLSIAMFSMFSLVSTALILFVVLNYYKKRLTTTSWLIIAFLYIFDPIHCIYTLNVGKDSAFAYAAVCFSFVLAKVYHEYSYEKRIGITNLFLLVLTGTLFSLLRSNGLYAFIFTIPFLLYYLRKNIKPIAGALCLTGILIFLFKGVVLPHSNVAEPDFVESLSMPLQQISYTVKNDGNLSDEDYTFMNNIIDVDTLGEVYDPHISDWTKNLVREEGDPDYLENHKIEFIQTYLSIGIKNPYCYLIAFFNQSKGYWHHKMSNYIYFDGVHRFALPLGLKRSPLLPESISTLFDKLMNSFINLWHLIWSLDLNTYVLLSLLTYAVIKKRCYIHFIPILGVFLTLVIATPVNDEFRYAYAIYLALPFLFADTLCQNGK